jgi:protein translocase SecG subunit
MATILPIIQIILSVILITGILLQNRSAGIGALGGSDTVDAGFGTRRGPEKFLFLATIAIAVIFMITSFLSLIIK